ENLLIEAPNETQPDVKPEVPPDSEVLTASGDWSTEASLLAWPKLELQAASRFVSACLIKRELADDTNNVLKIYREMEMACGTGPHVAVWLGFGAAWLLCLCKHADEKALQQCFAAGDALSSRLKFVVRPVKVPLPVPAKSPKDAEYVGPYFGSGACVDETKMVGDVPVYSVSVDLYSNWVVKMALQLIGIQTGNCIELLLVDWPQQAVIAGFRLTITATFKEQLGRCMS
ncbi:Parp1, partial [Symbiodinium necroappetens]